MLHVAGKRKLNLLATSLALLSLCLPSCSNFTGSAPKNSNTSTEAGPKPYEFSTYRLITSDAQAIVEEGMLQFELDWSNQGSVPVFGGTITNLNFHSNQTQADTFARTIGYSIFAGNLGTQALGFGTQALIQTQFPQGSQFATRLEASAFALRPPDTDDFKTFAIWLNNVTVAGTPLHESFIEAMSTPLPAVIAEYYNLPDRERGQDVDIHRHVIYFRAFGTISLKGKRSARFKLKLPPNYFMDLKRTQSDCRQHDAAPEFCKSLRYATEIYELSKVIQRDGSDADFVKRFHGTIELIDGANEFPSDYNKLQYVMLNGEGVASTQVEARVNTALRFEAEWPQEVDLSEIQYQLRKIHLVSTQTRQVDPTREKGYSVVPSNFTVSALKSSWESLQAFEQGFIDTGVLPTNPPGTDDLEEVVVAVKTLKFKTGETWAQDYDLGDMVLPDHRIVEMEHETDTMDLGEMRFRYKFRDFLGRAAAYPLQGKKMGTFRLSLPRNFFLNLLNAQEACKQDGRDYYHCDSYKYVLEVFAPQTYTPTDYEAKFLGSAIPVGYHMNPIQTPN